MDRPPPPLFAFGTLKEAEILQALFGCQPPMRPAVLPEHQVCLAPDGYLCVQPATDSSVDGMLLDLSLEQLRIAAEGAGVRVDVHVRHGEEPYREIIAEAAERNADLIVARQRGRRGFLAKMLVGEMVGKVATLAPCSVLLVPRAAQMWSHSVLAAVDFSPATMKVASVAAAVAASCFLPMLVVSVASGESAEARRSAEAAMGRAVNAGAGSGLAAEGKVLEGRAPDEVVRFAAERRADLIVVGRSGESGQVGRRLLGGTAEKISGLAECPVLVVKT